MRKGTHSCVECRRRKKSCITRPNNSKCTECIERGVDCLRQDAKPVKQPRVDRNEGLQERVDQLENMVRTLVDRLDGDSQSHEVSQVQSPLHTLPT